MPNTIPDPTHLTPQRPDKPERWALEEELNRLMRNHGPILAYRVPRTPAGWWNVQLRSYVRPLSLPAREVQALLVGIREGQLDGLDSHRFTSPGGGA